MLKKLIHWLEKIDKKVSLQKTDTPKKTLRRINSKGETLGEKTNYLSFFIKTLIILFTLFILGLIMSFLALIILFSYYGKDLPSIENIPVVEQSTKIFDRENNLLYQVHGDVNRTWIDLDKTSPWVEKATLVLEDKDFYNHPGFDWKGLLRVVLTHGYNAVRIVVPGLPWKQSVGGSTITQQLVKNSILSSEQTIKRKVQELLLARDIEQKYSKKQILELYLNYIPYGGNTYGIEAAAQRFFGISASSLTPEMSATLAALPQSPTYLSPYGNHIDALMERKDKALKALKDNGDLEELEYQEATDKKISFEPFVEKIVHPHFVLYAKDQLSDILKEKYPNEDPEISIERNGFTVKTTLDPKIQEIAELSVAKGMENASFYSVSNASLVSEDPKTGQILAMVGSVDFFDKNNDGQVNVALASRQPGSSIKPIIYLQAFLDGFSPATVVYDVKTNFGSNYIPNNYDGKFVGPISFREALAQSRNVPAVKALFLAGITDSIGLARDLGITTFEQNAEDRCGLSLVLGGCEVRLIDMVQAYSVINNLGEKYDQSVILEIKDANGNIVYQWKEKTPQTIVDKATAYQLIDVMSDRAARLKTFGSSLDISRKAAVKTGTTNSYLDAWTIGFVPQITAGVWAGNNTPSPMKNGGSSIAAPIWKNFMNEVFKLPQYSKVEDWTRPSNISEVEVSTLTGKLPSALTPPDKIKRELFTPNNLPVEEEPLELYLTAEICDSSGLLATQYCPDYLRTKLVYTFHHSIRPDLPNWEEPVIEWAKDNAETLNEEISQSLSEETGMKIKYISDPSLIPTEEDHTYNSTTAKRAPKLSFSPSPVSNLIEGTNILRVNIDAKNELDQIEVFLDKESVFKRKFLVNTDSTTISVFINPDKYPTGSTHNLEVFVDDVEKLRGSLQAQVIIKDDIIPPKIVTFSPSKKQTILKGNDLSINAVIEDNKNEIKKVELFYDGSPLQVYTNGIVNYTIRADNLNLGAHEITIRAYDKNDNSVKETHSIIVSETN